MRCTMFRKEETPMLRRTLSGIAIGSLASIAVYAQDLPKTQFKVIGLNSPTVASIVDEVPFCRETLPKASNGAISADITPLDQMGKKVRVFNNTMRDFLGGIGATAVSMAFAEVVTAINNGVVDCGVTGSLSGNTAGWPEVTKSLYPMSLGWSINVMAVNLNSWNRLDKRMQNFLLEQVKAYENKMWGTLKKATAEADNCNTGKQPCTMGKLAHITIVPVKPAEA